ncbi:recombination directionality factor [Streptomyces sp. NPDC001020]
MTQSTTARAGRFHLGRLSDKRPQALDAWRVTTDDADVAARIACLLGGEPQPNEGGGSLAYEVLTSRDGVRVTVDGPDAMAARMLLWGSKGIVHECDGSQLLSPEEKKGQPCGCPPLLEDKRLAARDGRGPMPSIELTFRIAAAPMLGEFHFMTSSWQVAAQVSDLTDALERVDGPAVCDLTMELVVLTTKTGRSVCYRKPMVTVLGSPDSIAPEPPPAAEPTPAPASSAPRRKARRAPEPATPNVPESACSVSVDTALLHRAAQVLGTSDHQETVIAALSAVAVGRQQTTELAQLRDHVGRIAAIAGQALRGGDSSRT